MRASGWGALALAATLGCSAGPLDVVGLPTASLADGQVAHWTFDEGFGAVANDSSGNGRTGSILGTGWSWTYGQFGGALAFSGVDQVSVPGLPQATQSYSVAAWLLLAPGEPLTPMATLLSTETPGGGWALYSGFGPLPGSTSYDYRFWTNPVVGYAVADCSCVVPGAWTHLAAVVDGDASTLTFYVNGVAQPAVPTSGTILPGSTTLAIARSAVAAPTPGPGWLTGVLDDVVIYDRALVAQEVVQLTKGPAPNPD